MCVRVGGGLDKKVLVDTPLYGPLSESRDEGE